MQITKVPTSLREREQSGPFKRRPRPKPGTATNEVETAVAPVSSGNKEHRVDVTA